MTLQNQMEHNEGKHTDRSAIGATVDDDKRRRHCPTSLVEPIHVFWHEAIDAVADARLIDVNGSPSRTTSTCHESVQFIATTEVASSADAVVPKKSQLTEIDPESDKYIQFKARRLCQLWPFSPTDEEDLTQELRLAWMLACERFNPIRGGLRAFLKTIIERIAGKLRKKAVVQARRSPNQISLHSVPSPAVSATRRQIAYGEQRFNGQSFVRFDDRCHLELDVDGLVAGLSDKQVAVCEGLKFHNVAELGRETGLAESTINSRITSIRKRHERYRLRDFL